MDAVVLIGMVAVLLWSLVSHRVERWGVAGPAGLLVLGAVSVVWDVEGFAGVIDRPASEKVVEVILAVLLFVDATEVKGGIFGNEGRVTLRLVLIALPLSLLLAAGAAALLLPMTLPLVAILIACIIMPTDFAPAAKILRMRHVPDRVRQILNVESGYNDGLVSPLFGMALPAAVVWSAFEHAPDGVEPGEEELVARVEQFMEAFLNAVPAAVVAILIGVALGFGVGVLVRIGRRHAFIADEGVRFVMALLPLVAYGISVIPMLNANGFVAAFVAGLAYRSARTRGEERPAIAHDELVLVEEVGTLASSFVWFVLGGAAVLAFASGMSWQIILLALLALTVLRVAPVYLSLMGSTLGRRDRLLVGALGPRGTASIVFGLLAYNALPDDEGVVVLMVMVATVVGSILLHGILAPLLLPRVSAREVRAPLPH
ncbi:cation:proton antiporter [Microbacterium pseudoresistens]|uniref:NhaP-type Na+/H+ or K+/H+ antiporter n=1 Tax=Microbacterium pseudoresistens TaxID=640634 RepID=A0A7Y9JNZ3_9MICO|nr:cation:proton antiporter [Microbacterium pseudoresistens]NYD54174.1 NhaP-type Na+/H+ or K+/H+ antiporter [Microbacterium pseudoresistens]